MTTNERAALAAWDRATRYQRMAVAMLSHDLHNPSHDLNIWATAIHPMHDADREWERAYPELTSPKLVAFGR